MTPSRNPDARFMAEALALAGQGIYSTHPNPRVGAVVVQQGKIIGRGAHLRAGEAHAEVFALAEAGDAARGATLYVTLEPCCHHGRTPPCTEAILAAGVARVVIATADPNPQVSGGGIALLRQHGIEVELGCLAEEATALNIGFIRRMRSGRPWIRLKQAQSLDGCVALASGESQWLTGTAARADVQRQRAAVSAIVVGIGTVLADNPRLAPRVDFPLVRYPHKVILDSALRTPPEAALWDTPGETWIFHRQDADPGRRAILAERGARLRSLPPGSAGVGIDLASLWTALAQDECNEVLVEAGPGLATSLLRGGWVDEWLLYLAPVVLGAGAQAFAHLGPYARLDRVPRWHLRRADALDGDVKLQLLSAEGQSCLQESFKP
ncbi:bifunctional diaminohydroxyphosphoribosylaminopyrimidine deaminase/5-amino-6-(5-phosphoribosylamino)uracil reductase RibD [Acidithiobacillus sp.]|uniref:bifunctional diaminohydroxyphosphoribosylaminopyrimidine deaminase/5-amino-6-(5-phosphoribosylamino)uracil reductase RibD n=1 Tax=Acidithiobacillus sp. TaxID=1872118 RepID=UPI0025B7E227|nr:bifunctional diaminohydroxyphosphoribosylaminopyrimidine deaminase/5-amino-6-(5-phosphoribosylamino)uracil reductase RibD [Acidithiobacillus sp.]